MFNRFYLSSGKVIASAEYNCLYNLESVHQVPFTAGKIEAVWNMKFSLGVYT